ncbi:hypothetical protein T265_00843 [Opisthorchis viverrini]|uniref:Uncharacterized protein n=1 Tax=Opisthorchis viverrini TaxID=6198 RepID=A0A075ABE2_OPIVI|nr:hypothetical protein T265_00843 [Opisthorchis viverrini]KER33140.1 hypothetical protein T265_00843 [Opisthorchis viverrini]
MSVSVAYSGASLVILIGGAITQRSLQNIQMHSHIIGLLLLVLGLFCETTVVKPALYRGPPRVKEIGKVPVKYVFTHEILPVPIKESELHGYGAKHYVTTKPKVDVTVVTRVIEEVPFVIPSKNGHRHSVGRRQWRRVPTKQTIQRVRPSSFKQAIGTYKLGNSVPLQNNFGEFAPHALLDNRGKNIDVNLQMTYIDLIGDYRIERKPTQFMQKMYGLISQNKG